MKTGTSGRPLGGTDGWAPRPADLAQKTNTARATCPLRGTTLLELSWVLIEILGDERQAEDVIVELVRRRILSTSDGRRLAL